MFVETTQPTMPKPTKTANELPRARVMEFITSSEPYHAVLPGEGRLKMRSKHDTVPDYHFCAVIPTRTAKEAKAIAAFFNLTEEERAGAIYLALRGLHLPATEKDARAVLDIITGRSK